MRVIWPYVLKGLATVLPVALTVYLVVSICRFVESSMHPLITWVIGEEAYWPGMGWLVGVALLFLIGLTVNAWLLKHFYVYGEKLIQNTPVVKSIYGALRDFTQFFFSDNANNDTRKVVWVNWGNVRVIGFVTRDNIADLPGIGDSVGGEDLVAVYVPQSYQVSGITVYVARDQLQTIDIRPEDAMRLVLTAGVSMSPKKPVVPDTKNTAAPVDS